MYNVTATIGPLVGKQVGYSSSAGQCGALASYWLSVLTDKVYQFAYGMAGINAQWVPGSDCNTAWNVYTQTDWSAIGFEKIDNPSFSQLEAGDIFFISARNGLPTGHVGIVASVVNENVTTYEQNIDGIMVVQELPDRNSWSIYGGFSGVVRKKKNNFKGEEDMKIITITSDADYYGKKFKKGACFCVNGSDIRYIERPQTLTNLEKLGVPRFSMSNIDLLYIIQDLGLKLIN